MRTITITITTTITIENQSRSEIKRRGRQQYHHPHDMAWHDMTVHLQTAATMNVPTRGGVPDSSEIESSHTFFTMARCNRLVNIDITIADKYPQKNVPLVHQRLSVPRRPIHDSHTTSTATVPLRQHNLPRIVPGLSTVLASQLTLP